MSAPATDWRTIDTAPRDGTRVRVAHELDPQSLRVETIFPTYGEFIDGEWALNAFFTCADNTLRRLPTHWMPISAESVSA